MSASDSYVFRSEWRLDAAADRVYAALADVAGYPTWWHEVRETVQLSDTSGRVRCRSLLPYDLTMVLTREIEDPVGRVLRAHLDGDLIGTSEWRVSADGDGTLAVFDEDVRVGKAAVRMAGRLARPVLTFNHDRMMRSGERGLRRFLGA
ncbi:MAG TPA: SRPBCC family protein [Jatrophihabitantaceae bacterium]|nr:SRPBCC family protein [Jatrophihabitantaceae bacterium]